MLSIVISLAMVATVGFGLASILYMFGRTEVINPVVTPSFGLLLIFMSVYILQFSFACMALRERFKLLNQYLK